MAVADMGKEEGSILSSLVMQEKRICTISGQYLSTEMIAGD